MGVHDDLERLQEIRHLLAREGPGWPAPGVAPAPHLGATPEERRFAGVLRRRQDARSMSSETTNVPAAELAASLAAIVGAAAVLTAPEDLDPYLQDWRGRFKGRAACVVRPANTAEVAAVMTHLAARGVPVVPQGGNTS